MKIAQKFFGRVILKTRYMKKTLLLTICMFLMLQTALSDAAAIGVSTAFPPVTIFKAAQNNNIEEVNQFINSGFDLNAKDENGKTALTYAIEYGYQELLKLYKECEANPYIINYTKCEAKQCNTSTTKGVTKYETLRLAYALEKGLPYMQIIKILMKNGAKVENADQWTKIFALFLYDDKDFIPESTALIASVGSGNTEEVRMLIEKGADVNQPNRLSNTPLITAVEKGDYQITTLLLDHGADVHYVDSNEKPILSYAAYPRIYKDAQSHAKIFRLLLDHGAKIKSGLQTMDALLIRAVRYGNLEIVESLLALGADPNTHDTPHSCETSQAIRAKGIASIICGDGSPVLVTSILDNHYNVAVLLLKSGAAANVKDAKGKTPLTYCAEQYGRWPDAKYYAALDEIITLLLNKGAHVSLGDARSVHLIGNKAFISLYFKGFSSKEFALFSRLLKLFIKQHVIAGLLIIGAIGIAIIFFRKRRYRESQ